MKNLLLFILACGLAGICIFLGSVFGHGVGKTGLFVGAIIGGILGVAVVVWLAARFGLLENASYSATFLGGVIGFIVAAIIAVNNLRGPVIPAASVGLIGIGAILGKMLSLKRAA
jgi:hypothetical protein